MLGHADIKTTSTYLNITLPGLHESMQKFEEARTRKVRLIGRPLMRPPGGRN